jgi:predicted DNA-binding transcriptional regulator AlpA
MASQLLKPEELRAMLNVSRSWLYEAANDGRIPCVRLGPEGPLRFDRASATGLGPRYRPVGTGPAVVRVAVVGPALMVLGWGGLFIVFLGYG